MGLHVAGHCRRAARGMRIGVGVLLATVLPMLLPAQQPARRFAADSAWRRLWTVGLEKDDDTFAEPRTVVVSGDVVVVLDAGTREVLGFDTRTGRPRFVIKARGTGPGEFKRPRILSPTSNGFAVFDEASGRVSVFSRAGKPLWTFMLPDGVYAAGYCVLANNKLLVNYLRGDSALVIVDTTGKVQAYRNPAWSTKRKSPTLFAHESFVGGPSSDNRCAMVRYFGSEWAIVDPATSSGDRVFRLVEPGAEPVMKTSEQVISSTLTRTMKRGLETTDTPAIAKGVMWRGDSVLIRGEETKQFPGLLIDYYDVRSGTYELTRRLPLEFVGLAVGEDGTYYGTVLNPIPALLAFRPERPSKEYLKLLTPKATTRDTAARLRAPAPARRPGSH